MSMNNKPFGNPDYPDFILLDQDPRDNIFMKNMQESTLNLFPNGIPGASNAGGVSSPRAVNAKSMPLPVDNEPSLINLNLDTLNRGLAEAEGNPTYVPLDMPNQSMYNGMIPTSSDGASAWANVVMQPGPEMAYGNQNLHMVENLPMVHSNGSINPYADYLASLQQADAAETGTVLGTGLKREITGVPNSMHTEIQCCTPVQMANMAGMAVPSFLSGMNGLPPKKKGVKATAYDLMSDFIVRIPMFTHEQDVYIYDNQKGYYKRTPQHEVEQMIMLCWQMG